MTAANTCSRADDQDRDTTAKNDDGQVAAPKEHDSEGDVEMGSTGSLADDQERGEIEESEQASSGAAAASPGEPKMKKARKPRSAQRKAKKAERNAKRFG